MHPVLAAAAVATITLSAHEAVASPIRAVALSGSEALVSHVLSLPGMPPAAAAEAERFNAMRGYRQMPGVNGQRDLRLRPVLSFDPNVNGGLPNDRIEIAGWTFTLDPEGVRKSGVLVGLEAQAGLRENIAPGLALDLRARGMIGYAPQHRVGKLAVDLDACLRYQANPSRYFHACSGLEYRAVSLGRQAVLNVSAGMTQAFGAGPSFHAVTAEFGVRRVMPHGGNAWSQGYVRLSTASALHNGTAITSSLEIGQRVHGVQATWLRGSIGMVRDVGGRPLSVSAFYSRSEGSMFLGEMRRDQTFGLSMSRQINDRVTLSGSISRTRSNASLFDTGPSLGLNLQMNF